MRPFLLALALLLVPSAAHAAPCMDSFVECLAKPAPAAVVSGAARGHRVRGHSVGAMSGGLVAAARAYMGTNPTGWARVWCGRFMAMIAPEAARKLRNPNSARAWAALPHVPPQVGAIAVLSRRGGGHVGVVSGFDAHGNPIIVSGNHGRRVGEGVYSKARVIAYVVPS